MNEENSLKYFPFFTIILQLSISKLIVIRCDGTVVNIRLKAEAIGHLEIAVSASFWKGIVFSFFRGAVCHLMRWTNDYIQNYPINRDRSQSNQKYILEITRTIMDCKCTMKQNKKNQNSWPKYTVFFSTKTALFLVFQVEHLIF